MYGYYIYHTYLYINTVMDGSVILFVRYRNHFPVVQFQNQAHIQNSHDTGQVCKTIWGAAIFFISLSSPKAKPPPRVGCPWHPNFSFLSFTAAEGGSFPNGRWGRPKVALKAPFPRRAREFREHIYIYIFKGF